MRYVIFGAGAIGGLVGARLYQSGHEVTLVARGAHYEKISSEGLTLATPIERVIARVPVVPNVANADLQRGDMVLLCVKTQHTAAALLEIRDAAPPGGVALACLQNGVENERMALRLFADVYGAVLLLPAEHLEPGLVVSYLSRISGRVFVGRYPDGVDARVLELSTALGRSQFDCTSTEEIQRYKYAKLIGNLENGIHAVCGLVDPVGNRELSDLVRAEGRRVLAAAGIEHTAENFDAALEQQARMELGEVDGRAPLGGSTWQSVTRGTGNVETDYLNGEIVMLARRFGIPAPFNELIQMLTRQTVRRGCPPGWRSPRELIAEVHDRSAADAG